MTMGDVETVAVHPGAEGLSGFANILETTPPALDTRNTMQFRLYKKTHDVEDLSY